MGDDANRRPRVVVVGGGFAGLSAVREPDGDLYNTFQPLLYQVATGGLNPGDVTYALRAFAARFGNAQVRRVTVTGVDAARRHVGTDAGDEIGHDYLVLCCGVTANYFGIPGAAEHARTVYTRADAIEVRDALLGNLEAYAQGRPEATEPVTVIVGAGATGVEMAGTLAELRNMALPVTYPELDLGHVRVVLVEMTDKVLGPFAPRLRRYTAAELRKRGVELRLGTAVKEVHADGVVLSDGERLPSAATVWATGVKVHDQVAGWGLPQGRGGRIQVEPDMRVVGHPEIFAVGDVAAQIRRLLAGEPTEPMVYRNKGTMATIGRSAAVAQLPLGVKLTGRVAWVGWLGLHIAMLVGYRNRLATLANLSVRYLAWPGRLNVIVGDPP